ncbi:MAG TPA: nitrogen fixation protein [Thermoanaerobaculia bacterium]|nr:nitrogen fixation protein [Thermoanaerobaculia bacterium]
MPEARVLGAVDRSGAEARIVYLRAPAPVTDELLALAGPLSPTRVFRFAAPCAGHGCQHFDGTDCRLAKRIVREMPAAVEEIAVCALRPACRWWKQEGAAACRRCPMIVTESDHHGAAGDERLARVADPGSPA